MCKIKIKLDFAVIYILQSVSKNTFLFSIFVILLMIDDRLISQVVLNET